MKIDLHDPEEFDDALSGPLIGPNSTTSASRVSRVAGVIGSFVLGQGASQAINVIAGLFLVHHLSIEAYAQYGVATGFQTVFSVLMDFGLAGTIVPLVGSRIHDRAVIGRYVHAARRLRNRTFWLLAPVASAAFLGTVHREHWPGTLQAMLLGSILISLYSSGLVSFFSAPLFLAGRLREYYAPQVISGLSRLFAYVSLRFLAGLGASTAAAVGALNITLNGFLVRKASRKYFDWPETSNTKTDQELLAYVLPAMPAIVFSAFQSQISLFLISVFGGTLYIAEVAALGRIGQLFAVLMTFNTIVIEPYMARINQERLLRNFLGFVLLASCACAPVIMVAFWWPDAFLWILGSKYEGLRTSIGWYVFSACMNFVSGLIWVMNRARKWVFWSGSILEVVLLLLTQALFLIFVGVRTTKQAVFFAVVSSGCYLVAHCYVSLVGFTRALPAPLDRAT